MRKITVTPEQILTAMEAAGMQIDHTAYDSAIATVIQKVSDEIDAQIVKDIIASFQKEQYEHIDDSAAVWEKLKLLQPYESGGSLHISEERYELDGVKYIACWEICGPFDIPKIMVIKERK
jgi:hypothetical protein